MNNKNIHSLEAIIGDSFDFSGYPENQRTQVVEDTAAMIMKGALTRALDQSSSDVQGAFVEMTKESSDENSIRKFINTHIPDFISFYLKEIKLFHDLSQGINKQ